MTTENIKKCEPIFGTDYCPLAHDSHCSIDGSDTSEEVPATCPLRKAPYMFQLDAELIDG